jgi:thioredoxin-like negative regulator of GroEL
MTTLTTYHDIQQALQKDFVMILAKSHTCSACQTILDVLKRNVPNLDQIEIHSVFIDDMDQFRGDHLIFSVPTVLIFSEGKELLRESRYINYDKITRLIDMFSN